MREFHGYNREDSESFPYLREALAPEYAEMDAEQLEALFEQTFGPGIDPEDMENIFKSIGKFAKNAGKSIGRVAQKAGPAILSTLGGAAQGAMSGAALGPFGMIGGAVLGGAGKALSQHGKGAARGIGNLLNTGLGVVGSFSPTGALGRGVLGTLTGAGGLGGLARGALGGLGGKGGGFAGIAQGALGALGGKGGGFAGIAQGALGALGGRRAGGIARVAQSALGAIGARSNGSRWPGATTGDPGGVPAAGQLLSLLGRPETMAALQAMMLSPLGRQDVQVGGTNVPVDAFANLLATLSQQAQTEFSEMSASDEGIPEYLLESTGDYRCDPADPAQRAGVLLDLLQATDESLEAAESDENADERAYEIFEYDESDSEEEALFYDALELEEIEAEYEEAV